MKLKYFLRSRQFYELPDFIRTSIEHSFDSAGPYMQPTQETMNADFAIFPGDIDELLKIQADETMADIRQLEQICTLFEAAEFISDKEEIGQLKFCKSFKKDFPATYQVIEHFTWPDK